MSSLDSGEPYERLRKAPDDQVQGIFDGLAEWERNDAVFAALGTRDSTTLLRMLDAGLDPDLFDVDNGYLRLPNIGHAS